MDMVDDSKKENSDFRVYDENMILHQREILLKEKYSTLKSGMYINNRIEKFDNAKLFDGQMEIMLPESFGIMPDLYLKIKYPSQFRPQIILTKADLSVNLGFTLFSQKISEEELEGVAVQIKNTIKRANPTAQFYSQEIFDTTNCKKVWFDFRTQALDESIYNIQFLAIINSYVMLGTFNCMYRDVDEWYETAKQIVESITDVKKERRI